MSRQLPRFSNSAIEVKRITKFTKSVSCDKPGTDGWNDAVSRGKRLIREGGSADNLYDCCQNIRKMYFLRFLNEVGVLDQIGPAFRRELERAAK